MASGFSSLFGGFVIRIVVAILVAIVTTVFAHSSSQAIEPESKILMVLFFDQNCHAWCGAVRPIVAELKKTYSDQVDFVEIDVTQSRLKEAKEAAKELKISSYLSDVSDLVPEVAIFSAKRKICKELVGPKSSEVYENELKNVLRKRG
jgi:hypothetical protein